MTSTSLKLLVVDDESDFRLLLRGYLQRRGYEVTGVGDAESALDLLRRESFDLVLLDNYLPGAMGITVLPKIVALTRAPVIMITGHSAPEARRDAELLGAKGFLSKPFELPALEATLRGALS